MADARDRAAEARDRASDAPLRRERMQAALDRAQAASDRAEAARDREQAVRDREQAAVDDLTGALRREHGVAELRHEIDRARRSDGRLVVAFVDVDGLKAMNDAVGHAAGDELLRDVVAALRGGLRSYDLVVRYGGDEFVCALSRASIENAERRFEHVKRNLRELNPSASVSVGLAALLPGEDADDMIARADADLYARARPVSRRRSRTASRQPARHEHVL